MPSHEGVLSARNLEFDRNMHIVSFYPSQVNMVNREKVFQLPNIYNLKTGPLLDDDTGPNDNEPLFDINEYVQSTSSLDENEQSKKRKVSSKLSISIIKWKKFATRSPYTIIFVYNFVYKLYIPFSHPDTESVHRYQPNRLDLNNSISILNMTFL